MPAIPFHQRNTSWMTVARNTLDFEVSFDQSMFRDLLLLSNFFIAPHSVGSQPTVKEARFEGCRNDSKVPLRALNAGGTSSTPDNTWSIEYHYE